MMVGNRRARTRNKFLYLVEPQGRAIRYGIGVGRPGFMWSGVKQVSRKAEWPAWTPPPEMLRRRPDLPRHIVGGPANPLGARALYLGSSLYRIDGTNEPDTIGFASALSRELPLWLESRPELGSPADSGSPSSFEFVETQGWRKRSSLSQSWSPGHLGW